MTEPPRCVVLVEGPSDAAVLDVIGRRLGLAAPEVRVVSMGGVTNIRQHLEAYDGVPVTGLCDGSEMRFFARALRRRGHEVETRTDLEALGFFVCEDDLEDELIRALGTDAVIEVVAREGELGLLHTFQQQPRAAGTFAARPAAPLLRDEVGAQGTAGRGARRRARLAPGAGVRWRGVLAFAHAAV